MIFLNIQFRYRHTYRYLDTLNHHVIIYHINFTPFTSFSCLVVLQLILVTSLLSFAYQLICFSASSILLYHRHVLITVASIQTLAKRFKAFSLRTYKHASKATHSFLLTCLHTPRHIYTTTRTHTHTDIVFSLTYTYAFTSAFGSEMCQVHPHMQPCT